MTAVAIPLRFQLGARTVAAIPRRLIRVARSLDDVLSGALPGLAPLPADADGYLITSLPAGLIGALGVRGMLLFVRQRYVRYHADLRIGEDAWLATLSGSARSGCRADRSPGHGDRGQARQDPHVPALRAVRRRDL